MKKIARARALIIAFAALSAAGCREHPAEDLDARALKGERIVSLAPSLTEMIAAIGADDLLVGRSSACDYPPETVRDIPVVGAFGVPSIEALLARRPTLVVDVALADKTMEARMRAAGLRREHIPCAEMDDIPAAFRHLGDLLGRREAAEALALDFERAIGRMRRDIEETRERDKPLVFVELWSDPLMTVGRRGFVAECIRLAGGDNLGDEEDRDYYYISHERVIRRDPDIVALISMDAAAWPVERVAARIGWESLKAVRSRRIYAHFDPDTLLRPGPRVLQGIARLREAFAAGYGASP